MQRLEPQLAMKRDLAELPQLDLPEGYYIRAFDDRDEQDEKAWNDIIGASFETDFFRFDRFMRPDKEFRPDRIIFVCAGDKPVGTASAWYSPGWGEKTGYVHMVGVLPSHAGKGLGYHVTLAALIRMKKEKREAAVLTTDDFRIPAIKTYLKLGFTPLICHENHTSRWKDIFEQLKRP